jgi:hypothetical protein
MLVSAVQFWQFVLAVHIAAVIVAFGVTFAYPLFGLTGARLDPRAMPWFHRMQQLLGRRLISPGLGLVLIAGIYLASHLQQWKSFYVQWGLGVVIVLGALEGAVMARGWGRLAEIAERDVDGAAAGTVQWSPEYVALRNRLGAVGTAMSLLVLVTVYLMSVRA